MLDAAYQLRCKYRSQAPGPFSLSLGNLEQRVETKLSDNNFYQRNKTFNVLRRKIAPPEIAIFPDRGFFFISFSLAILLGRSAHLNALTYLDVLSEGGVFWGRLLKCTLQQLAVLANDSIFWFRRMDGRCTDMRMCGVRGADLILRKIKYMQN